MDNTHPSLTWTAPSHIQPKRSTTWYMGFILVATGLISYAFYTKSIITAITFFLIIAVVLVLTLERPKLTIYKITKTGIIVGRVMYPFGIIKKFWIVYHPPQIKTLNFETTAYLNNKVILQLGKQDPISLKMVLSKYIEEDLDQKESLSEGLARKLKI